MLSNSFALSHANPNCSML
uniref:Uncharacterized protein n=1 Tax=Anguilla anguilla TaxID=7936 RepID=A0A0E9VY48_ANGAN